MVILYFLCGVALGSVVAWLLAANIGSKKLIKVEANLESLQKTSSELKAQNEILLKDVAKYEGAEEQRRSDYEKSVANVNKMIERLQKDEEQKQTSEIARLAAMQDTWVRHEEQVKESIKMICQKHTIECLQNVPFRGKPDNALKISDEYTIFDAKSPKTPDELGNFYSYLKVQADEVKKYTKEESVKKDVFFVVPNNTLEALANFCIGTAEANVYLVPISALEPIIVSLKKIELYKFVDQLSPEDHENICRIIGRFTHLVKRRIAIDQFLDKESLATLTKCDAELPDEIKQKSVESEKLETFNPPMAKKGKFVTVKDLKAAGEKIQADAAAKKIPPPDSDEQKKLPIFGAD